MLKVEGPVAEEHGEDVRIRMNVRAGRRTLAVLGGVVEGEALDSPAVREALRLARILGRKVKARDARVLAMFDAETRERIVAA